ncbi:tripartite tricarboxylate transporter TctB family protein [Pseudactinotalea sp. HY158]|uniref:tripartite tricarboxylate transporter TctB family protein n=1 Tax=Pseudactinotalea sp. HY158 TaxID=2654547 RepID=UPI00129D0C6F|nr:tripartite tricarboxylate transporter TctB family protein [Pseudactinotalea sp. HY158]QGH68640.1 tripartite tricarboxylate transporter TctB family protein [Pseudactinotalea sp. HY158]
MSTDELPGADLEPAPGDTPGLPPSHRLELLCGGIAIALSLTLIGLSRLITVRNETGGVDPRWWPTVLGVLGLVLSIALVIVALTATIRRDDVEPATTPGLRNVFVTAAVAVAYVLAWPLVGFIPATVVLLVVLTATYGARSWKALVLFPAGLTAFLYLLFATLLKVPL